MLNVLDFIASADVHCHINQVVPKRDCLCKVTNVTIAGGFCPNLEKSTGDVSKLISCDPIITKKNISELVCIYPHTRYFQPLFRALTSFDGTTNSKSPHLGMCWLMNKTYLSLIYLNTKHQQVKLNSVKPHEINESDIRECVYNITNFLKYQFHTSWIFQ